MAGAHEIHIESERLFQELRTWRSAVTSHRYLFDKDAFLKEFLGFKLDIVQGLIEELQGWEETGNETKCQNAIDNSEFFLGQIQVLIDRVFADQYQENWQDIKEERIFTDHIPVS
jgi:hypothetical protein